MLLWIDNHCVTALRSAVFLIRRSLVVPASQRLCEFRPRRMSQSQHSGGAKWKEWRSEAWLERSFLSFFLLCLVSITEKTDTKTWSVRECKTVQWKSIIFLSLSPSNKNHNSASKKNVSEMFWRTFFIPSSSSIINFSSAVQILFAWFIASK